jgi:hypothetical protein
MVVWSANLYFLLSLVMSVAACYLIFLRLPQLMAKLGINPNQFGGAKPPAIGDIPLDIPIILLFLVVSGVVSFFWYLALLFGARTCIYLGLRRIRSPLDDPWTPTAASTAPV